jgi:hypothetical protein
MWIVVIQFLGAISDGRPYRDLKCARVDPTPCNSCQDRRILGIRIGDKALQSKGRGSWSNLRLNCLTCAEDLHLLVEKKNRYMFILPVDQIQQSNGCQISAEECLRIRQ